MNFLPTVVLTVDSSSHFPFLAQTDIHTKLQTQLITLKWLLYLRHGRQWPRHNLVLYRGKSRPKWK